MRLEQCRYFETADEVPRPLYIGGRAGGCDGFDTIAGDSQDWSATGTTDLLLNPDHSKWPLLVDAEQWPLLTDTGKWGADGIDLGANTLHGQIP